MDECKQNHQALLHDPTFTRDDTSLEFRIEQKTHIYLKKTNRQSAMVCCIFRE